ncbi:hypothetical protein [Methylobacterium radiotolerans]|nr:hypothetical protein [Methylobacterium radiotolerans]
MVLSSLEFGRARPGLAVEAEEFGGRLGQDDPALGRVRHPGV